MEDNVVQITDAPDEKSPKGWQEYWTVEVDAAEKRMKAFQAQGNRVNARFLDERSANKSSLDTVSTSVVETGGVPFRLNLFHTNITTMQAMLYGSTPQIDVSREHHDPDDDVARVASVLYQRILQADVEASGEDFPTTLKAALQDRLIPGLGIARVRYDFKTTEVTVLNPETMEPEESEQLEYEEAPVDYVHWQDFMWGWGRTWNEVPWLAYRSFLTKEQVEKRFSKKVANNLQYKEQLPTGTDDREETVDSDQRNHVEKAEIWEFWHKQEKKVFWWSKGAELILDIKDDPLGLDGFWPSPMPMMANLTTTLFMPKADFVINQDLYNEIDTLQSRISIITRAIKVVGVYDQNAGGSVGRMLKEGVENDLIPVDNWAMFAEKGGLQGTIQWFPVQEVVGVLNTLQSVRDQTIELLYQVTGMSDVLRGANTDQYTSDGTNQLKAKFGSIRVQALQDDFARFASDLEGLKAEIISKHFSPESIAKQSSAQFLPQADHDKIEPALQLMQSPDVKWRVDIRPESIAMIDYAQLKSERTEYLGAVANYLQSATSMAKEVPESLPILLEFLKFGMVGFKGANYMEGMLDQAIDLAKNAPPKKDDQADQQQQMAQMAMQMEMSKIQAKSQADMQSIQAKSQAEIQKIQMDNQANLAEQTAKDNGDMQKLMADLRADLQVIQAKLDADLQRENAQSTMAVAEEEVQHRNNMIEAATDHSYTMDEMDEQELKRDSDDDD